jgi:hypothetical protein
VRDQPHICPIAKGITPRYKEFELQNFSTSHGGNFLDNAKILLDTAQAADNQRYLSRNYPMVFPTNLIRFD